MIQAVHGPMCRAPPVRTQLQLRPPRSFIECGTEERVGRTRRGGCGCAGNHSAHTFFFFFLTRTARQENRDRNIRGEPEPETDKIPKTTAETAERDFSKSKFRTLNPEPAKNIRETSKLKLRR